jgi:hypothetical protein
MMISDDSGIAGNGYMWYDIGSNREGEGKRDEGFADRGL